MNNLGKLLKRLRGKESLREASKRTGVSHTYLSIIEKGYDSRSGKPVKPTPETLKLLAKAYNYSYEELLMLAGYLEDQNLELKQEYNVPYQLEGLEPDLIRKFAEAMNDPLEELFFDDILSTSKEEREELIKEFLSLRKKMKKEKEKDN